MIIGTACFFIAGSAFGAAIVPSYDEFEDLPDATWGGTGIPTGPAAVRGAPNGAILGLIAHQRYNNPPLQNDGAGTYFAQPGANDGTPGNPGTAATWNIGFYVNLPTSLVAGDEYFRLYYDLDPSVGTDISQLGQLDFMVSSGNKIEGSENMSFGFWLIPFPGNTPASYAPFDPFATGEYSFALVALDDTGTELPDGRAAIIVRVGNVGTVPDAGSTFALLGGGLVLLTGLRRLLRVS
ncbi:MAG TPA: VPDSG-CTERM sorting domain-containing protein [Verrucomicrobiae bacterium]|nr:VPDSG-CTERM sorting domain-containing protein [Verrucomicrobiae bacterium]